MGFKLSFNLISVPFRILTPYLFRSVPHFNPISSVPHFNPIRSVPHFNPIRSVPHFNPISVPFRSVSHFNLIRSVPHFNPIRSVPHVTPSVPFRILTPSVPHPLPHFNLTLVLLYRRVTVLMLNNQRHGSDFLSFIFFSCNVIYISCSYFD
jgi:hypothetical protein